jgi:hypothetical protein
VRRARRRSVSPRIVRVTREACEELTRASRADLKVRPYASPASGAGTTGGDATVR